MTRFEWFCLAVFAAAAAFIGGHFHGRSGQIERHELQMLEAKAAGLELALGQATARVANERRLRAQQYDALTTHLQEKDRAQQTTERLVADLRADNRRLRIPISMPACPRTLPGGSTAPGAGQEGHADLTAGAAEFLVRLTARGDDAIRKHAQVVDSYDRLAAACAAPLPTTTEEPTQ